MRLNQIPAGLLSYALTMFRNWWFRCFFFLSAVSTFTTFYASFHPGFLLPRNALFIVSLLALLISPYDVYRKQQETIQEAQTASTELKRNKDNALAVDLANLASELEDNLRKANEPIADRTFGGGAYVRPTAECWKAVRNRLQLGPDLHDRLNLAYAQIDRWTSIVDSGVKPGMGSPELNRITAQLWVDLPGLLDELRRAKGK
jgi:hypothetical protein